MYFNNLWLFKDYKQNKFFKEKGVLIKPEELIYYVYSILDILHCIQWTLVITR